MTYIYWVGSALIVVVIPIKNKYNQSATMNYHRLDKQAVAVTRDFLHRRIHVYKTPRTTLHTKSLLFGYMDTDGFDEVN